MSLRRKGKSTDDTVSAKTEETKLEPGLEESSKRDVMVRYREFHGNAQTIINAAEICGYKRDNWQLFAREAALSWSRQVIEQDLDKREREIALRERQASVEALELQNQQLRARLKAAEK